MKRCTKSDLLVEHCADCRRGKHATSYETRPRPVQVEVKAKRDDKIEQPSTTPLIAAEAAYLLRALDRLAEAVWVDEAMVEIRQIWVALTRAHGLVAGSAVGPCLVAACDGKVYRNRFTGFPECNVCHRVYEGIDALKVRLTEEAAG